MYGTDVQLIAGKPYRALRRIELLLREDHSLRGSLEDLIPGTAFLAWRQEDQLVAVTRDTRLKQLVSGEFISWDDFTKHCEAAPAQPEGYGAEIRGEMRPGGPNFTLYELREDVDAGIRDRRGSWWLDLVTCRHVCEVLADGKTRKLERESDGRLWKLEWTLDDPRHPEEQVKTSLADQLLWFFPGGEDWTVFRMSCTKLIHLLSREVNWLLALSEQPHRAELNALDRAARSGHAARRTLKLAAHVLARGGERFDGALLHLLVQRAQHTHEHFLRGLQGELFVVERAAAARIDERSELSVQRGHLGFEHRR